MGQSAFSVRLFPCRLLLAILRQQETTCCSERGTAKRVPEPFSILSSMLTADVPEAIRSPNRETDCCPLHRDTGQVRSASCLFPVSGRYVALPDKCHLRPNVDQFSPVTPFPVRKAASEAQGTASICWHRGQSPEVRWHPMRGSSWSNPLPLPAVSWDNHCASSRAVR